MTITAARRSELGDQVRSWVLIVLAFGQIVTSGVVFGGNQGNLSSGASDPTITPAGYAFVIWTIPIAFCLIWSVMALRHRGETLYRVVGWPLAATMAGFSMWLWFAAEGWLWATVVVFVAMLGTLSIALREAHRAPGPTSTTQRVVLTITLGVYAGWTTVAVWANLAAALHASGGGLANNSNGWQIGLLVGATVSSLVGVWLTRAQPAYTATVLWALVAVIVATASRGAPILATAAVAATVLICGAAVAAHRRLT